LISHPAEEEGIGLREVPGRVTMQLFVRDECTMIAAPVQRDVDGIPKESHCVSEFALHSKRIERSRAEEPMDKHRIFTMSFAGVYPLYVLKAEKKGRKKKEVDEVICWLTGYSPNELAEQIRKKKDFETFFSEAPALHPNAGKITGVICGVRIEEIEDPLMRNIRRLDKLVDELAKGRPMEKILRE
jgi:hypothetical protein